MKNNEVVLANEAPNEMNEAARRTGHTLIFRTWITRNGRKIYARDYGRKAWAFWI